MNTTRKVPMRQCIGCGEMKVKKDMMRVIKTKEGDILLDVTGKKNGRGAYLCFSQECFEKARANKGLSRSLKTNIPDEIYHKLKEEIESIEK